MAEIVLQEENLDYLLIISLYCKNYRKDIEFWDQASDFFLSDSGTMEDENNESESLCDPFPNDFLSLSQKVKGDEIGEKFLTGVKLTTSHFIVSNRGGIFGDHDCKQRL